MRGRIQSPISLQVARSTVVAVTTNGNTTYITVFELLQLDLNEIERIDTRIRKALRAVDVQDIKGLVTMPKKEFEQTPGIGKVSRKKIGAALKAAKLHIGMELEREVVDAIDRDERRFMRSDTIERRTRRLHLLHVRSR